MNRIRELRKARDWTAQDLAAKVGTSSVQITRLETGERRLTVDWMNKIAAAMRVAPAELLSTREPLPEGDDIGPPGTAYAAVASALMRRGLRLYSVQTDAVADAGVAVGDTVTVDETPDAASKAADGDLVLVEVEEAGGSARRLLRQYLRPRTLLTNRPGVPIVMTLDDPGLTCRIVGVIVRE